MSQTENFLPASSTSSRPAFNRQKLVRKLLRLGLTSKIVRVHGTLYLKNSLQFIVVGTPSRKLRQTAVLQQVDKLSPLLFINYIADLSETSGRKMPSVVLFYADDLKVGSAEIEKLRIQFCFAPKLSEHKIFITPAKCYFTRTIYNSDQRTLRNYGSIQLCPTPSLVSINFL